MLKGTIRCPHCSQEEELEMPTDHCIPFVACANCGQLIEAKGEGDECCVFCRYGLSACPIVGHHG
jgi:uncharacterized Zn finger protein